MLRKALKLSYILLFFLTPLVMFGKTSELFEFNKMLFIYFCSTCVMFIMIMYWFVYKTKPFKSTLLDIPLLLFFVSQVFSTLLSIDQHTSFFGYYGRFNGGLLSLISYLILYYGFVLLFSFYSDKKKELYFFLQISIFSSFLTILWSIPGKFGHDLSCLLFVGEFNNSCWTAQFNPSSRMFSTLGQPNWFGAYLAIHFFIGLFLL